MSNTNQSSLNLVSKSIPENAPFSISEHLQIVYVLSGSVNILFTSSSMELKMGDVEIINIGEPFCLTSSQKNSVVIFKFDNSFTDNTQIDIKEMRFNCNFNIVFPANVSNAKLNNLRSCLDSIIEMFCAEEGKLQLKQKSFALFEIIVNDFDDMKNVFAKNPNSDFHSERFISIYRFICNNFSNKISLSDVAQKEHISLHYLSKEFSEKCNITFSDLLSYYRIRHSIYFLLNTQKSIIDISETCGFSSVQYYYKYFKKYLDCTPKDFRKKQSALLAEEKPCGTNLKTTWDDYKKSLQKENPNLSALQYNVLIIAPDNAKGAKEHIVKKVEMAFAHTATVDIEYLSTNTTTHDKRLAFCSHVQSKYSQYNGIILLNSVMQEAVDMRNALQLPIVERVNSIEFYYNLTGHPYKMLRIAGNETHYSPYCIYVSVDCLSNVNLLISSIEKHLLDEGETTIILSDVELLQYSNILENYFGGKITDGISESAVLLRSALSIPQINLRRITR